MYLDLSLSLTLTLTLTHYTHTLTAHALQNSEHFTLPSRRPEPNIFILKEGMLKFTLNLNTFGFIFWLQCYDEMTM